VFVSERERERRVRESWTALPPVRETEGERAREKEREKEKEKERGEAVTCKRRER